MSDGANQSSLTTAVLVATIGGREAKITIGVRGLDAPPLADLARACFDALSTQPARSAVSPIVCAFEEGAITMTPELWDAALEQRGRLGRPLDGDDLRRIAEARGARRRSLVELVEQDEAAIAASDSGTATRSNPPVSAPSGWLRLPRWAMNIARRSFRRLRSRAPSAASRSRKEVPDRGSRQ